MTNNELYFLASSVFSDEHYGASLTSTEVERIKELEIEYRDEIMLAKMMLEHNPGFMRAPFESKVNMAAKLIITLRQKKENSTGKIK